MIGLRWPRLILTSSGPCGLARSWVASKTTTSACCAATWLSLILTSSLARTAWPSTRRWAAITIRSWCARRRAATTAISSALTAATRRCLTPWTSGRTTGTSSRRDRGPSTLRASRPRAGIRSSRTKSRRTFRSALRPSCCLLTRGRLVARTCRLTVRPRSRRRGTSWRRRPWLLRARGATKRHSSRLRASCAN